MGVQADVEEVEVEGRPGLVVTCEKCGHAVEVYGTSGASARRGAVMLSEECPEGEKNFYVVDWDE